MSEKVDLIQLRRNGFLEQALTVATERYTQKKSAFHLTNRGMVYLQREQYDLAIIDFETSIALVDLALQNDFHFMSLGIGQWCLFNFLEAVQTWTMGLEAPYTDAAGGIILPSIMLYAGIRLKNTSLQNEALQILNERDEKEINRSWPGPVAPLLLNKISSANVHQIILDNTKNEILRDRRFCQLEFYTALKALTEGNNEEYQKRLQKCFANPEGFLEPEYYLARWEIQNDFPEIVI